MILLEWCTQPESRNGTFLPEEEVNKKSGFRSVYGFKDKPTSSKGLNQYKVYSDTLFLDFDDGMRSSFKSCLDFVKENGLEYKIYVSGNKGAHFHIPLVPMYGAHVPYSQYKFVTSCNLGADMSLYRHGSLFRLPNTVHRKTGKKKELIEEGSGSTLEIDLIEPQSKFAMVEIPDEDLFQHTFNRYSLLIDSQPSVGGRTLTLWSVAKNFSSCGISFDTTLDLCHRLNESWNEPKEESEVLRAVRDAYKL